MTTFSEALAILSGAIGAPGPARAVPLAEALGRVLAREIVADVDWPPFDTSAMDGYAVRVADAASGQPLAERVGLLAAGEAHPEPLRLGEAVRIMTGAPLPAGAEAIVPVERAHRDGGFVRFDAPPVPGAHLRRRGESIPAGSRLAAPGRKLRPADVALAALAGADPLAVFPAPRIAVAATGNEVVRGRERPAAGRLRDSNGPMLVAECRALGWDARRGASVPDDPFAVRALFEAAGSEEDFLVTTGGVSAGDLDLLPDAAVRSGFEMLFHGVAIRPGKPVAFARRGRTFWIGLPGNPVSASVAFHLFAREALARFEGDEEPAAPRVRGRIGTPLPASGDRDRFFDAIWSGAGRVDTILSSGSHDLAAYALANALIHCPAGTPALPRGAEVSCILLGRPSAVGPAPAPAPTLEP